MGPSEKSRIDIRQELFRQIVTLDEPRILSRLRSRHTPKAQKVKGRPQLLPSLSRAVHDESIFGRDKSAKSLIASIQSSSKELSQSFSDFEIARGNDSLISASKDMLVEILTQIEHFDVDGLSRVLAMSQTINPNLKAYFPRAMSKIGRYFCIARDLINAARSPDLKLFRRLSVQPVERPQLDMSFLADHLTGFDQVVQRVTSSSPQRLPKAYGSASISNARTKFESRMSNCPTRWKIHAEVQLLLFYEQYPHVSRPRIIGSSKSACYLCDKFIQLHGDFCIPRTHGRLYDRWMLPVQAVNEPADNKHLLSMIDRLSVALEAKIIKTLHSRPVQFPHPNESVLVLRKPWLSTSTLSELREQVSIQVIIDPTRESASRDQTEPLFKNSPYSLPTRTTSNLPIAQRELASIQETVDPNRESSAKSRTVSLSTTSPCSLPSPKPSSSPVAQREQLLIQETVDPTHQGSSRNQREPPIKTSPYSLPSPKPSSSQVAQREQVPIQNIVDPTPQASSKDQTAHPPKTPPYPFPTPKSNSPLAQHQQLSIQAPKDPTPQAPPSDQNESPPQTPPSPLPTPALSNQASYPPSTQIHPLSSPSSPITITTAPFKIHLSRSPTTPNITASPPTTPTCHLHTHVTTLPPNPTRTQILDIASLPSDRDIIVSAGAALSAQSLALRLGGEFLDIKYTFEHEGNVQEEA